MCSGKGHSVGIGFTPPVEWPPPPVAEQRVREIAREEIRRAHEEVKRTYEQIRLIDTMAEKMKPPVLKCECRCKRPGYVSPGTTW